MKSVYFNGKRENTFIRTGEGDRRATKQDFLTEIGACFTDRVSGEVKLWRGALLFLGQERTIKEIYPHYHLDYMGNVPFVTVP